jgi:tRNA modification GTPase
LAQAEGSLRSLYEGWRTELLRAQALVEAGLDFADEGDVAADVAVKADAVVALVRASVSHHLADRRGERLRDGVRIVIAGPPNVGKSSLLNALAKRDVAIVSEEAGTTRDVLEVHLDLGGLPVTLTDTAGLRETESKVEAEGVRRALSRTEQADVVLWLVDAAAPIWELPAALETRTAICVLNKIDLEPGATPHRDCLQISAKTGQGLDQLIEDLEEQAAHIVETGLGSPLMTRARHRAELDGARTALGRFGDPSLSPELKAEELRIAARHLGRLTGRIDVEEVLGAIFGEFCIGK